MGRYKSLSFMCKSKITLDVYPLHKSKCFINGDITDNKDQVK